MNTPPAGTAGATNLSGHPSHWPSPIPHQSTIDGLSPQHAHSSEAYPYEAPSIGEILKRKRKARAIKACFPCRHRKVRCDGNLPCSSCIARNHTDLCRIPSTVPATAPYNHSSSYSAPPGPSPREPTAHEFRHAPGVPEAEPIHPQFIASPLASAFSAGTEDIDVTISRLEKIENEISALKADLIRKRGAQPSPPSTIEVATPQLQSVQHAHDGIGNTRQVTPITSGTSPGTRFVEDTTGATIFLGSHSDPPLVLGCRRAGEGEMGSALLDQMMPKTYPFADLWRTAVRPEEICQALPNDSDVLRYWQIYQTYVYPFYPALVTLEQFSVSLFEFLDQRSAISRGDFSYDNIDAPWLALLFSVLALGVQFSDDPIKERDLRSKVFICSAFQFLRISNIFHNINLNQIQAMALIGHFLRNNQDTNSAWVLMGSTVRLAQSIGLHEEAMSSDPPGSAPPERAFRRRFWWMLVWQDAFLSMTYDRPPITFNPRCVIPISSESTESGSPTAGCTFSECVFKLVQTILERSHRLHSLAQMTEQDLLQLTITYKQRFDQILAKAAPFLSQKLYCRTLRDHLERLGLRIHIGYGTCRFLRFYLQNVSAPSATRANPEAEEIHRSLSQECAWKAAEAVESFLDMHRLSSSVCRSWAFVHNVVSCAIALHSFGAHVGRARVEDLIGRLTVVLEKEEKLSEWCDGDTNRRHYGPYYRALKALKETFAMGAGRVENVGKEFQFWEFH